MRTLLVLAVLGAVTCAANAYLLPADPRAIVDVKRDCGAKGDGVADDTDAIQSAIERLGGKDYCRWAYLPAGTYRITKTIVFRPNAKGGEGAMVGPWLIGEARDKVVIRLADGAEGFSDASKPKEAIRGVSRPDGARMNADFFDRTVVDLTIDTGKNPGAVGIKFYSNNTGIMRNVRIVGDGACGIDLGSNDQNGPCLVQDVEIDGFAVGVRTNQLINSQTLSRITVKNAREAGLIARGQSLAVEGLKVVNAPLAVECGDKAVLALVDCEFAASKDAKGPAIKIDKGALYAARIKTIGYASAVAGGKTDLPGPAIDEYTNGDVHTLGDAPKAALGLRPPHEPDVPYPVKADEWVCAEDFGAKAGDEGDDAPAFQKAIDEAARKGASTVYILGGKAGDPNWYHMKQDVKVHGSVRRVTGVGFVRILGGDNNDPRYPENLAKFVIDDEAGAPPVVAMEHLQVFAPRPSFGVEVKAKSRTVLCRTMGGTTIARAGATVFMTNCVGHAYQEKGSKVWARQWNTEGGPEKVRVNTRNDGGLLWVLGLKTEAKSIKIETLNGGRTEVLGVHNYNTSGVKDDEPFFRVKDGAMSVAAYREVCFVGAWWKVPVSAEIGDQKYVLPSQAWQTYALMRCGK